MWDRLLDRLLERLLRCGRLRVTFANGMVKDYGDGTGAEIAVLLHHESVARKLILSPELAMGEAYMDAHLTIKDDDLRGFLVLVMQNAQVADLGWLQRVAARARLAVRRWDQHNPLKTAKRNVEHHYDLSDELYDLFLDADKQYTCAYFPDPDMTLEAAQAAKQTHIAKKLLIKPGMKILDIGCGWGGTCRTLAREYGAQTVGVTLSQPQLDYARARAKDEGLAQQCEFRLTDYRDVPEQFDRIVTVGMMEHVGQPHFSTFFDQIRRNLKPDGIALVHHIGRTTPPGVLSPWYQKYIFPGGYSPAMSEVMTAIEKSGLCVTDVEVWRMHYVQTLHHWQQRFERNIDAIRALYDDRFCRMWRYYLITAELSFSQLGMVVFQFQISRDQCAVPLTRDYLYSSTADSRRRVAE
jgi:cyclopropane-fatty-acyl-phospholipid synthase